MFEITYESGPGYFTIGGENFSFTFICVYVAVGMIVSYFIGNISPAILLGRIYGVDVTKEGSGNAGTTNVLRTVGKKAGVITLVIDILKGFIPTLITSIIIGSISISMIIGTCVMLGHMWPVVFKFKGGKGVATTLGILLAVQPLVALIMLGIVAIGILITRRMSVGVLSAAVLAVPIGYFFHHENLIWLSIIALLIIIKHKENIKRIFSGNEPKISFGSKDKNTKS